MAIVNDLNQDVKKLMMMEQETTYSIGDKMGMPSGNVSRTITTAKITEKWLQLVELLGYDIKITYVKRQKSASEILKK